MEDNNEEKKVGIVRTGTAGRGEGDARSGWA